MFRKAIFLICILLSNQCLAVFKYDIAVCSVFQNEAPYLKEWIEFHRLMGVQHFYLFNHKSTDHYLQVLSPYVKNGIVELFELSKNDLFEKQLEFTELLCQCFTYAAMVSAGVTKWLAPIDTDEFLFPTEANNLVEVSEEYEDCPGLAVNWQLFGTSYVEDVLPGQLMIEMLTHYAPTDYIKNLHIKSILQPQYVAVIVNPHYAFYIPGIEQVNTDRVAFAGPYSPYVQVEKLRINHYWARTNKFFRETKLARHMKWNYTKEELIQSAEELNVENSSVILRFVEPLKQRMGLESTTLSLSPN